MINRKRSGTETTNSPAKKRSKLSVKTVDDGCRDFVLKQKALMLENIKRQYHDCLVELSFLQAGSQIIDYYQWRNSRSEQMIDVLRSGALDEDDLVEVNKFASGAQLHNFFPLPTMAAHNYTISSDYKSVVDINGEVVRFITCENKQASSDGPRLRERADSSKRRSENDTYIATVVENGTSNGLNDEETAQREIVEKARQEATAMQRVAQLRKDGLWSARRLPKVTEPPRRKAHWDYVLEEMQWLAVDFAQERKWKKAAARKIAYAIQKKFKEREDNEKRAEREEMNRKKRIASSLARMVREWWQNIGKVVQYKQKSRLQEMRKKALDVHLNYIVDQTERFSEWLTEGMQSAAPVRSDLSSGGEGSRSGSDEDFNPETGNLTSEDDEETIARAEAEDENSGNDVATELDVLRQESAIPLDELLNSLPVEMLSRSPEPLEMSVSEEESTDEDTSTMTDDAGNESSCDDESTLEEQEKHEGNTGEKVKEEIAALEEEADLPIEELISKYGGVDALNSASADEAASTSDDDSDEDSSETADEDNESAKETSDEETEKAEDSSVASLDSSDEKEDSDAEETQLTALLSDASQVNKGAVAETKGPNESSAEGTASDGVSEVERNFSALAAEAESLQPTGYTLESTEIKVRVPFLIKHTLREYQHVGLDWLATMYDKRLNGILADEMGLGKTIQTIALLAHLACEKGIWGPHLIVVPTSVMLNWELEFKKWCPAFKILTYFGSQKERKEKRKGWTKTNAFHVCITSYKLAIQDHSVFKRKKWKYLCLDEAQNIKNFKSKRWQTLLTFNSQRRLLLTGTPLQNSLMELWSLMHFLMPHVFQSHREFREWFANPLTGMIEGSQEYNELIVKRLHKVLRPFILRRLKKDVEKQMPQKYEHVVMCRLSRRQRFLYDDFMSRASTKDSLSSGHFMSVINILMQLRKVCNHPNLFEPRPTVSPFKLDGISYTVPSLILNDFQYHPLEDIDIRQIFPSLVEMDQNLPSFVAERIKQLKAPRRLIEEIDSVEKLPTKEQCCASYAETSLPVLTKPFIPREVIKKLRAEQSAQSSDDSKQGKPQSSYIPQATPLDQLPGYVPNRRAQATKAPDWTTNFRISTSVETPPENRHLPASIISERRNLRRSQLNLIATLNDRRCDGDPLYGCNVISKLQFVGQQPVRPLGRVVSLRKATFLSRGYHNAYWAQCQRERTRGRMHWCSCSPLEAIVNRPEDHLSQLQDVINRFVFCIPTVWSPGITISAPHLPNEHLVWRRYYEPQVRLEISPKMDLLHTISRQQTVRFAEARLIQYDCGKLQTLDLLLRKLKKEEHRVLIFTQMTKMLDVLEQFLSYHGHRYLRLDGTTRVEQRQALMERFNADNRIFCFILSTRSGGLGVNLTGADTVIFYDSDWNPTMDAQAQDRCHRIGQTRDVHIYRLISEKTIEENILKKANQKRFLSDVAIEGGKFTTAHFRQNTLKELFAEPSGLEDFVREKNATATETTVTSEGENSAASSSEATDLERCLEECEDDNDRIAASKARAEAKAELAEFDETIPWDEQEANGQSSAEPVSRVEAELQALENELSFIERYAVNFIEVNQGGILEDELEQAENRIQEAKRNWELEHAKALRDAEEMRAEEEEDDMLYCYGAYDITNQCFMVEETGDLMPLIAPPSPSEEDFYVDDCLALMYDSTVMTESQLPNFWSGRDKLMYANLLVTPSPASAQAPGSALVPTKQVALVPRERAGPGHAIVKRRKLATSNVPGLGPGAGPGLVRQPAGCGPAPVVSGAPARPALGPSLVPSRHYRAAGPGGLGAVKAGSACQPPQLMERERPIAVNAGSGPAVAAASGLPPGPAGGVGPSGSSSSSGERMSSTAQAAQLRSLLPRAVFQRDSAGTHKMRGRSLPPYPARHRAGLPTVRGHSLGSLVPSKLHQEWTAHEESALFTSMTQLQDIHFNSAMAERYPCWQVHSANFLLAEFFINTYSRPRCFRSHRHILSHYESLQTSLSAGQHAGAASASALLAGGGAGAVGAASASPVGALGAGAGGPGALHAEGKAGGHPGVKMKRKSSVAATGQHRFRALTTPTGADNPAAAAAMANSAEGKYASWLGVAKTVGKRKRPPGLGPPGAGSTVATQGMVQRNSLHVAALQESGINPDLLLGPMQIIKQKEEREQRMKEQQGDHPPGSGSSAGAGPGPGPSTQPGGGVLAPGPSAVAPPGFAHPSAASAAHHKLQVASSAAASQQQQQRILVPGAVAAGVSGAATGANLAALQRRGGVITSQGAAAALSAAALRRTPAVGGGVASVGGAQASPRILQRPQAGGAVQMTSLIRQQHLPGMAQVAKRSAAQAGAAGAAGAAASAQPTASARIQALTAAAQAGVSTTVAMVNQQSAGPQFRAAGIGPAGAAQARLVTATGAGMVGHGGSATTAVNTAQVAAIIRAKQAAGGTLVKSLSCGQRLQAGGSVTAAQAAGAGPSMGTPVQIIQQGGQRGVQTTVTVQQIQQLIRHQSPNVQHIISGPQGMATSAGLRRTGAGGQPGAGGAGEHIVISRYPSTSVAQDAGLQQGLGSDLGSGAGSGPSDGAGLKDSVKKPE